MIYLKTTLCRFKKTTSINFDLSLKCYMESVSLYCNPKLQVKPLHRFPIMLGKTHMESPTSILPNWICKRLVLIILWKSIVY